jgi:hypothetical protein
MRGDRVAATVGAAVAFCSAYWHMTQVLRVSIVVLTGVAGADDILPHEAFRLYLLWHPRCRHHRFDGVDISNRCAEEFGRYDQRQ